MWTSWLVFLPVAFLAIRPVAFDPFVNPLPRTTELPRDRRYRFALNVRFDRMFSFAFLFLRHAFLQKEDIEDPTRNSEQRPASFQRTVNDVVAHLRVNDVVTLVT